MDLKRIFDLFLSLRSAFKNSNKPSPNIKGYHGQALWVIETALILLGITILAFIILVFKMIF